jgi:hypothetical protein
MNVKDVFGVGPFEVKELTPLQEQVIDLGVCPLCKKKSIKSDFVVEGLLRSVWCGNCSQSFWIDLK